MDAQQTVVLLIAVAVGVLSLVGALATWRALSRSGAGLRKASGALEERALLLPMQLRDVQTQLATVNAQAEHTLWMLGNLDDRIDKATAEMRAKRVASDTLHVRLIEGR